MALLIVAMMVVQVPVGLAFADEPLAGLSSRESRATITSFDGGAINKTYQYDASNVVRSASFTLPNNAYIDEAELHVNPLPRTPGGKNYPDAPQVDVGDDGEIDWSFDHTGFGKFGYQFEFYNDSIWNPLDLKANIKDNSTKVRLPLTANVSSASLNIEGRFRFSERLSIEGTENGEYLGRDVSFVGDLNGDTWPDFAIGSPRNDSGGFNDNGRVLVFFGGAALDTTPELILNGTKTGGEFGYHVGPAGDVNNDGKDDLLVDAPSYDGPGGTKAGRLYVYYGGNPMDTTPDVIMDGESVGDWLGICAVGAGDLNGDGYDDIAATSPNWRLAVAPYDIYGKLYIFFGGNPMNNVADLVIQGPTAGEFWGKAMAMAGDINNDGYDDLVIGTYTNAVACNGCGRVDVLYGGSPMNSGIDLTIFGSGGENLGYDVTGIGDINKDNYDDFIVGAIMNNMHGIGTGAVYLYYGGSPANNVADLKLYGPGGGDYFGCTVAPMGDINKDGWLDFAVGAEQNLTNGANTGAVFIYFGGSVLDNVSDQKMVAGSDNDLYGHSISGATDIDKDTYPDILVGAYQNDSKANDGGRAALYLTVPKRTVDPVLEVEGMAGNQGRIWNTTGLYFANKTVPDFYKVLNSYLSTANPSGTDLYGNQYVDVRLTVKSASDAEVIISNLSITYDFEAVISVKPNGGSLQQTLDDMVPHKDTGTTKVVLWARSNSAGKLFFHTLKVVTDDGPTTATIPDQSIKEDTAEPRLIDLYDFFSDDIDPDDYLNYSIVSYTNSSFVNVSLNSTHYLSVDALAGSSNDNWTGRTQVQLKVSDTRNLSKLSNKFFIVISAVNDPPLFTTVPGTEVTVGKTYSYQAKAIDGDKDAVTFILAAAPVGMVVDAAKGLVTWTPAVVGSFNVALKATDGMADTYQNFTVKALPPNDPPVVTSKPVVTAKVGYYYTYKVTATDKDGDPLTARLVTGPTNMTMDNTTWVLSFIPSLSQAGDRLVSVQISDGKVNVSHNYTLSITSQGMNNVPQFTSTPWTWGKVGWAYVYNMTASDPDKDTLRYSMDIGPSGMAVRGPAGNRLDWTPSELQTGSHEVVVRVSDGKSYALQSFMVNVSLSGSNRPPVITSTPVLKATVGFTYEYQIKATDDDLDPIIFSLDTPKDRTQIDPDTGLLIWHPTTGEIGNQTMTVKASDGKGFGFQTFVVLVSEGDRNGLPRFLSTPVTEAKVGFPYAYNAQAADPDMDSVTYTLGVKPDGMTVELTTGAVRWTPSKGQDGNFTVEIRASDGKGFSVQRFVIRVVPADLVQVITVTIESPQNNSVVSKNMTIEGKASVVIGRVFEVQIKLDNGNWISVSGLENWSYKIDTTTLRNGKHKLYARAWDGTTYSSPVVVDYTVENKNGPTPDPDPTPIFGLSIGMCLVGLIVLIVIIIGVVLVIKKTSTPSPPRTRPPPRQPYERGQRDDRYPPRDMRDRRGPPPPGDGSDYGYDQDHGHDQGYDARYDEGQDQHYDQGNDQYGEGNYDEGYDQGHEGNGGYDDPYNDQGYQDGRAPNDRYSRR